MYSEKACDIMKEITTNFFIHGVRMKIEGFLFDLDGTLANTLPLCIKVYQQSLEHFTGRAYSESEVTAHFGVTEAGIFQRMLPGQWEEALDYYHALYEKLHAECAEPFVGIKDALAVLKKRNVKLAIVTGKGTHTANVTTRYLGLDRYFERIEAGKEDAVVKAVAIRNIVAEWHIEPEHAAYIGDTDSDMREATTAGVLALAAEWADTSTVHLLETLKPYAAFPSVESFVLWIEQNVEPNK
jgi:pyrophosphatase PpaX